MREAAEHKSIKGQALQKGSIGKKVKQGAKGQAL